jgi:hypothetical protein
VVDTAGAKKEHRCGEEYRAADHAGRRRSEGDEHDATSQGEGSHSGMQPTTQPGLDCVQDFGQGLLGIAVGGLVFPKVNFGQGFSLPTPKRESGSREVTGW